MGLVAHAGGVDELLAFLALPAIYGLVKLTGWLRQRFRAGGPDQDDRRTRRPGP